MLVLTTGGRDFRDSELVDRVLRWWHNRAYEGEEQLVVLVGDCPTGADAMVREWCEAKGVIYLLGVAPWNQQGKRAGPRRNLAMVAAKPDALVAFPGNKGTAHCTQAAQAAGIPIYDAKSSRAWMAAHA